MCARTLVRTHRIASDRTLAAFWQSYTHNLPNLCSHIDKKSCEYKRKMADVRFGTKYRKKKKRARKICIFVPDAKLCISNVFMLHVFSSYVRCAFGKQHTRKKHLRADGCLPDYFRHSKIADRINVIGQAASNILCKLSYHFRMF